MFMVCIMQAVNIKSMKSSKSTEKTGRPPTGRKGRPLQLYATDDFIAFVDDWRASQRPVLNRSEAIRRLVETHPDMLKALSPKGGAQEMSGEPSCKVCCGLGTYPIIDRFGSTLYEIKCPECLGISDAEIERSCAEDRAVLEQALAAAKKKGGKR